MLEISRFLGIVVAMYFDEHNPPHFHVKYNEYASVMSIADHQCDGRPFAGSCAGFGRRVGGDSLRRAV
jgi:Domain of unknown function (DUF4160)